MTIPLLIGLAAGVLSGFLGIGGATIIIPALIYIYNMSQHASQGTAIFALLLPVGLLASFKYWQAGNVNIKIGLLIALGFFVGAGLGATFVQGIPEIVLRRVFAVFLTLIALQLLFF